VSAISLLFSALRHVAYNILRESGMNRGCCSRIGGKTTRAGKAMDISYFIRDDMAENRPYAGNCLGRLPKGHWFAFSCR